MAKKLSILRVVWWIVCLLLIACGETLTFRGTEVHPPRLAQDFTLTDQHGRPFRLSEQQGRPVLLFFGYISCPDVCPTTLGTWKQVHKALGEDASRVRFVFVTVDPEKDTPEKMQTHLNLFGADFVGLTGTAQELEPVYRAYGIYHNKVYVASSQLDYTVDHTATEFLIDPQGNLRVTYSFGTMPEDIAHDLQQLLK